MERHPETERIAWRWRFRSNERARREKAEKAEVDEDAGRPSVVDLVGEHIDPSPTPVRDRHGRFVSTREALLGSDD
jgi:hypothetical protein